MSQFPYAFGDVFPQGHKDATEEKEKKASIGAQFAGQEVVDGGREAWDEVYDGRLGGWDRLNWCRAGAVVHGHNIKCSEKGKARSEHCSKAVCWSGS